MNRLSLITLLALLFFPSHAFALASLWQRDDEVSARLISSTDGVGQEKDVVLGLELQLAPEWHTYWRSPGMAGLPPQLDWQNSLNDEGNLKSAQLLYPAPRRYIAYGLETVGYRDHVVFPIAAALLHPGQSLSLDTTVSILVCSSTCVPKSFELKLVIPAGPVTESAEAPLLKQATDQLPSDAETSGLVLRGVTNDGEEITISIESRDALNQPDVFVEDEKDLSFGQPVATLSPDRHSGSFKVKPLDSLPEGMTLAGMKLTLTLVNGSDALERKITVPPVSIIPAAPPTPALPLRLALFFALVGGFILNLMPCVLPVLSLKVLSAIGHGGGETKLVRRSFLMTAAGIIFSFLILAAMTIALKALGFALGWGVQFQQPLFLIVLVFLLTFFTASLWGILDIHLPRWLTDGISGASYHPKLAGDFATGAFATLLATPCTAPFLGTAVGFALSSGPRDIGLVFACLGLGMALPYLAIAAFPSLAVALPKPGIWMVRLRQLLGCALAATALWLIWVLAAQISPRFASMVGLLMAGILVLLAFGHTSVSKRLIRFGIIDFMAAALIIVMLGSMLPKPKADVEKLWLPFDQYGLAADLQEGKTVFVNVTADWCLTCKANQKLTLSETDVSNRLFHGDVLAMQADWTNPDPIITDFLRMYHRYGIPFNIVFGPGSPKGIILPELLTHDDVMKALDDAEHR